MIAKISSGASFGGALNYLMNQKQKERQQEPERRQGKRQGEAGRAPSREAGAQTQARGQGNQKSDERGRPGTEKPSTGRAREGNDLHPEHGRDLAGEYEAGARHRVIGGNVGGNTPRELAQEFNLVREQRPDIKKPVHHASISAGENDHLSVQQWQEIADTYIEKMGFQNCPYVVIQHRGSKLDHIHILTSRVDADGKVISEWQSKRRAEKVMREVEQKYDLERVRPSQEKMRELPTRSEQEVFERTGRMSVKMGMQSRVERTLRDAPTVTEFIERLEIFGIETIPNVQRTGRVSGVSFRQGKELMKGSDLGRGYSWNNLQKRGLDYDPARDRPAIEAAQQRAAMSRAAGQAIAPEQVIATLAQPTPERSIIDSAMEIGKSAGQYLLDRANPVIQVENQLYTLEQAGRGMADLYNATRDLLSRQQENVERLQQATTGLQPDGRDAIQRLHEAAGLEPSKDTPDALERLNQASGADRLNPSLDPIHSPTEALEKMPGSSPALEQTIERVAEQEVAEHTLEMGLELLH